MLLNIPFGRKAFDARDGRLRLPFTGLVLSRFKLALSLLLNDPQVVLHQAAEAVRVFIFF